MAYLIGSYIATNYSLEEPFKGQHFAKDVLLQLNLAHIFTPIFMILGQFANHR
jgi:hypothetical protein